VIGVASSGLHSNGYSLARKTLLDHARPRSRGRTSTPSARRWARAMIRPTRIYARAVRAMLEAAIDVRAISHITGGGLPGNAPRVLPDGTGVVLDPAKWPLPPIFSLVQRLGEVALPEMRRTFNMGLGLLVVVPAAAVGATISALEGAGERAFHVGEVESVPADTDFEARVRFTA
jgi:phosphoribosylformylglycinamidine cyclo-ligase